MYNRPFSGYLLSCRGGVPSFKSHEPTSVRQKKQVFQKIIWTPVNKSENLYASLKPRSWYFDNLYWTKVVTSELTQSWTKLLPYLVSNLPSLLQLNRSKLDLKSLLNATIKGGTEFRPTLPVTLAPQHPVSTSLRTSVRLNTPTYQGEAFLIATSRNITVSSYIRPFSVDWNLLYSLNFGEKMDSITHEDMIISDIRRIQQVWARSARIPRIQGRRGIVPTFSSNFVTIPNDQPSIVFNADRDVVISPLNRHKWRYLPLPSDFALHKKGCEVLSLGAPVTLSLGFNLFQRPTPLFNFVHNSAKTKLKIKTLLRDVMQPKFKLPRNVLDPQGVLEALLRRNSDVKPHPSAHFGIPSKDFFKPYRPLNDAGLLRSTPTKRKWLSILQRLATRQVQLRYRSIIRACASRFNAGLASLRQEVYRSREKHLRSKTFGGTKLLTRGRIRKGKKWVISKRLRSRLNFFYPRKHSELFKKHQLRFFITKLGILLKQLTFTRKLLIRRAITQTLQPFRAFLRGRGKLNPLHPILSSVNFAVAPFDRHWFQLENSTVYKNLDRRSLSPSVINPWSNSSNARQSGRVARRISAQISKRLNLRIGANRRDALSLGHVGTTTLRQAFSMLGILKNSPNTDSLESNPGSARVDAEKLIYQLFVQTLKDKSVSTTSESLNVFRQNLPSLKGSGVVTSRVDYRPTYHHDFNVGIFRRGLRLLPYKRLSLRRKFNKKMIRLRQLKARERRLLKAAKAAPNKKNRNRRKVRRRSTRAILKMKTRKVKRRQRGKYLLRRRIRRHGVRLMGFIYYRYRLRLIKNFQKAFVKRSWNTTTLKNKMLHYGTQDETNHHLLSLNRFRLADKLRPKDIEVDSIGSNLSPLLTEKQVVQRRIFSVGQSYNLIRSFFKQRGKRFFVRKRVTRFPSNRSRLFLSKFLNRKESRAAVISSRRFYRKSRQIKLNKSRVRLPVVDSSSTVSGSANKVSNANKSLMLGSGVHGWLADVWATSKVVSRLSRLVLNSSQLFSSSPHKSQLRANYLQASTLSSVSKLATSNFILTDAVQQHPINEPSFTGNHSPFSNIFFFTKAMTNPLVFKYILLKYDSKLFKHRPSGVNANPMTLLTLGHQLDAFTFANRVPSKRNTNLISAINLSTIIQKKVLYKLSYSRFSTNVVFWKYRMMVEFMEVCTGRKIAIRFDPAFENGLSTWDRIKCSVWEPRVIGFRRLLGPRIFPIEAMSLTCIALRVKDPTFLGNFIRAMAYRLDFFKQKLIFRFLRHMLRYVFFQSFAQLGIRGVKVQLKGKICVAGNARTRTYFYKYGEVSQSRMDSKVAYDLSLIHTFTGVMGFKIWFFY